MPVFVDAAIHEWRGKKWCHLFSPSIDELHAFAARLGLQASWFQQPPKASWPHYDITEAKRIVAIRRGAIPANKYQTLLIADVFRKRLTDEHKARLNSLWLKDMLT